MADTARRGVLFDVDGTLVDTTYLHTVSWWQALREYDHDVPMARIHRAIGLGSDTILDHLLGKHRDRDEDEEIIAAHDALQALHWSELRPLPGAAALLRECAARGLTVVLASSAAGRELAALRTAIGADDAIATATTADDAETSKPAPDILGVALQRADLHAADVVYVGDAVWDVYAAAKLDIPCVGLTCGGTSAAELAGAGAVEVYDNPAALLEALDASILMTGREAARDAAATLRPAAEPSTDDRPPQNDAGPW
jgi:HAD superfamily hydrolase (TIGR01509 family)